MYKTLYNAGKWIDSHRANSYLQSWFEEAEKNCQAKDFKKAEDIYREILKLEPNNISALLILGFVCLKQNKPEQCDQAFQDAIQLEPKNSNIYFHVGRCYLENSQYYDKAEKAFQNAINFYLDTTMQNVNIKLNFNIIVLLLFYLKV